MDNQKIGNFIYNLRKEKNLTQKDLAETLNVTIQAVSKWERGLGCPDISLLRPLADFFCISISELLNGERIAKKDILEKADDILMKNFEENRERKRKDRILFCVILLGVILLLYILTMNVYAPIRMILAFVVIGIVCYTPVILEKKMRLWHILIPILMITGLVSFDYIAVSCFRREPILYYNIETANINLNSYKRYDSIFYSAFQCTRNAVYVIDSKKESPDYYCKTLYETNTLKSSSITSKEGYVYFLAVKYSDNKNYKGNNMIFLEGFDLTHLYENEYFKDNQDEERWRTTWKEKWDELTTAEKNKVMNRLTPHGDADWSLAPKEIQDDLNVISHYLANKKFIKEIKTEDLSDLELSIITKEEVVELFNKVITSDKQATYGYEINKNEETKNGITYEIVYMKEQEKLTHVKINLKQEAKGIDTITLKKIEDKIVEKQTFDMEEYLSLSNNYRDLINILKEMN